MAISLIFYSLSLERKIVARLLALDSLSSWKILKKLLQLI